MIEYTSTRGGTERADFRTALLAGLAPDGGLFVPERWPSIEHDLDELGGASYPDVVAATMAGFTEGFLSQTELRAMAGTAYATFGHPETAPITDLGGGLYVLELFWGPTLAFKDMAMQMLSRMLDRALADEGTRATILGATSGDTGSAAIEALRDRANLDVVILYPDGRVTDVQRRQMTTVTAANVHAIAIEGTFDDCQDIVKLLFARPGLREGFGLSSANSINWGRVVSQIPYYVWAATRFGADVSFAVPSGNFGNAFSGYAAAQMGVPIDRIAVGSNTNHVLSTFFTEGVIELGQVVPTVAPSMDIQIPSNLERLLFDLFDRDGAALAEAMGTLRADRRLELGRRVGHQAPELFFSAWTDDDGTRATMRDVYATTGVLVDPHTAIGIHAARRMMETHPAPGPVIALSTAHPAKFPEVVRVATGVSPLLPEHLADLHERTERRVVLPNDPDAVVGYLEEHIRRRSGGAVGR